MKLVIRIYFFLENHYLLLFLQNILLKIIFRFVKLRRMFRFCKENGRIGIVYIRTAFRRQLEKGKRKPCCLSFKSCSAVFSAGRHIQQCFASWLFSANRHHSDRKRERNFRHPCIHGEH